MYLLTYSIFTLPSSPKRPTNKWFLKEMFACKTAASCSSWAKMSQAASSGKGRGQPKGKWVVSKKRSVLPRWR